AMIEQVQQQQHELQQQSALLQTTLDSLGEGVIAADNSGKMTLFNHKAREILGQGISDKLPEAWPEEYGVVDGETGKLVPADKLPLVRALGGQTVAEHELCLRAA
ncbi:MAG: hypothetical protein GTO53_08250, partial [Planctomycetales bacterium]|nr:hypothetical protein [Planctomycetales bacterium]NIM09121.1 hypothetical protein [Planctomycetales bacterium]NIN77714.1 hypothetical protein [Planctomycetales bacterium]